MKYILRLVLFVSAISINMAARRPGGLIEITPNGCRADSLEPVLALPVVIPPDYTPLSNATGTGKPVSVLPVFTVSAAVKGGAAVKGLVGRSKQGRPVEVYYFPGTSDKRAMIIGGVHGSELSSIEVAKTLIARLQEEQHYYSVLIIPCLFPDNAATAQKEPALVGSGLNQGRYTTDKAVDPNRQMPALGQPFNPALPFDFLGRPIEMENTLLLELIHRFGPERIVNIHAIRDIQKAGIYADPRTDHGGYALGFDTDSSLAIDMANFVYRNGGIVPGNRLDSIPTAVYHSDPPAAPRSAWQKRNVHGSQLPGCRGHGVSLGSWASTAVYDPLDPANSRAAIRLFTMEFPGCKRPVDYLEAADQHRCGVLVDLYASAILRLFLNRHYEEI